MNNSVKKTIGFSNFKAFGENVQTFSQKPITLIYSPNSVGKSSVIHAIAYLHHLIQGGNPDLYATNRLGDTINLGGFKNFVHKHETDRDIVFRINIDDARDLFNEYMKLGQNKTLYCYDLDRLNNYLFHESGTSVGVKIKIGISHDEADDMLSTEVSYFIDDKWIFKIDYLPSKSKIKINSEHQLADLIWNSKYTSFSIKNPLPLNYKTILNEEYDEVIFGVEFFSIPKDLVKKRGVESSHNYKVFRENSLFLISYLNKIIFSQYNHTTNEGTPPFDYLAPLRFYPEREFSIKSANLAKDYRSGEPISSENAWYFLGEKYVIGEIVNEWLSDANKLATTYKIRHLKLVDLKSIEDLMQTQDFNNLSNDEKIKQLLSKVESEKLVFQDLKKGVEINNRDLGLGISQVIPILVAANAYSNTTVAIEQPELHLHPKAQCELADEFIRAYHKEGNSFILETHSEHLLLRIMKRMRQTASGVMQDELLKLTPADVCLLYIDTDEDVPLIKELSLSESGDLLDIWPNGFFEERLNERFDFNDK